MDNLELIIAPFNIDVLDGIMTSIHFHLQYVENAHFYVDGEDIHDPSFIDWYTYFSRGATCSMKLSTAYIGIVISDVIVIISGDITSLELTINFPAYDTYLNHLDSIYTWMDSLSFPSILGYEPAVDDDCRLYTTTKIEEFPL